MEKVKTKMSIKHFSDSEKAILEPYTNGSQKITFAKCVELSSTLGREAINIYQYVYRQLKKADKSIKKQRFNLQKVKVNKTITHDKSVKGNTPLFKHGEFVIPVSSWEVRSNNGNTSLVLKFDKSI